MHKCGSSQVMCLVCLPSTLNVSESLITNRPCRSTLRARAEDLILHEPRAECVFWWEDHFWGWKVRILSSSACGSITSTISMHFSTIKYIYPLWWEKTQTSAISERRLKSAWQPNRMLEILQNFFIYCLFKKCILT